MDLSEVIYKRKSCRSFTDEKLDDSDIDDIEEFISDVEGLYDIKTDYRIIGKDDVKSVLRWRAPHYLAIFSEDKENCYENVGFIYEQVSLYIETKGLGSCWVGLGNIKDLNILDIDDTLKFVILIAFGKTNDDVYRNMDDFIRNSLSDISDTVDDKLKPVLYAPSAMNSQPWYFVHDNDSYDVYRVKLGVIKRRIVGYMNNIDIGIALSHMYITNKDTFEFFIKDNPKDIKGYYYEGSFKI